MYIYLTKQRNKPSSDHWYEMEGNEQSIKLERLDNQNILVRGHCGYGGLRVYDGDDAAPAWYMICTSK
jgi:hypothetical protein